MKTIPLVAALAVFLTACGGDSALTESEIDELRSDPRVVRLTGIAERADSLLVSTSYARYSIRALGQSESGRLSERFRCSGTRCEGDDSTEIDVADLFDTESGVELTGVDLGSRGQFDTATARARFRFPEIEGVRITNFPSSTSFGFWGDHGYAAIDILNGPMAGRIVGESFDGELSFVAAYAFGDATGTNPTGSGSATWRGNAEAASTRTFERRAGSATLTIADLARPRVNVDIDIAGYAIDSPAWGDIPLSAGGFEAGARGGDYIDGKFHGPRHDEAYGVFDTGAYIGAFGAKRSQ